MTSSLSLQVEKCLFAGKPCSLHGAISFADLEVKTICRQKYTFRRLLAINERGQDVIDSFQFPSSCVCYQIHESPFGKSLPDLERQN